MRIERLKDEQRAIIGQMQTLSDDMPQCPHCEKFFDQPKVSKRFKDGSYLTKCPFCKKQFLLGVVVSYVGTPTLRQVNTIIKRSKEK